MNALTTIDTAAIGLALPDDLTFDAWADLGRSLLTNQRRAEWLVADWGNFGRKHFQAEFGFMAEQAGVDVKRLSIMAAVADAYPEGLRATNLTFDTHREIAAVSEPGDRVRMLKQAADETWTTNRAHHEVVQYKHQQCLLWDDDDKGASWATEMIRCWNRAPTPDDRRYAFELMQASGFAPINEDEVTHV